MTTVADLIEQLSKYPGDLEVLQSSDAEGNEFNVVDEVGVFYVERDDPDYESVHTDSDLKDQYGDEDIAYEQPGVQRRPEAADPWQVNFDEDELDNQDPHGKHAAYTLDEQPQELNSSARVGDTPKPGIRLRLEDAGSGSAARITGSSSPPQARSRR